MQIGYRISENGFRFPHQRRTDCVLDIETNLSYIQIMREDLRMKHVHIFYKMA